MLKDYTENTNKIMGYASKNSLKQKFAVLQSIGMTGNQLVRMLILEGDRTGGSMAQTSKEKYRGET